MAATDTNAPRVLLDLHDDVLDLVLRRLAPACTELTVYNADVQEVRHGPLSAELQSLQQLINARKVCRRFKRSLPSPSVTLVNEASSRLPRRDNPHRVQPRQNFWLPPLITLSATPTLLSYEIRADGSVSECIAAFSLSKARWAGGNQGEDALTWYAAPHRNDFNFRTRMFHVGDLSMRCRDRPPRLQHARWYRVDVALSTTAVEYTITPSDGAGGGHVVRASLLPGEVPTTGYLGMISYESGYSVRNIVIAGTRPRTERGPADSKTHTYKVKSE